MLGFSYPIKKTSAEQPYEDPLVQIKNEEQKQKDYLNQLSKILTVKAQSLVGSYQGQCVLAVRHFLGVDKNEVQGAAKNTKVNSYEWSPGAIIIFRGMSKYGHVAVSLFADQDNWLYYWDSNADGYYKNGVWHGTGKAKIRKIKLTDKKISGYRKVDLTHILTN